jgi:5,10-methylenetetrahydromethanopterin reductase
MSEDMTSSKVNVLLHGSTRPEEVPDLSRFVEALGFSEVWLSEDYFFLGGFTTAAMALQATSRLKVGLGVIASVARHPAVTAMEISTLARAYPNRFMPGIGHGAPAWTKQMGLFPKSILTALRETISCTRRLLAGETVTQHEGHFFFDGVSLHHPVEDVKLYAGVSGPKSLELSGEIADGTLLGALSGPEYIRYARGFISRGIEKSHLLSEHKVPTLALYAVDRDRKVARDAARSSLAFYLAMAGPTALTEPAGINDDLAAMLERGGAELLQAEMPDEWIDKLAIAGNPEECAARAGALLAAGASSLVLAPIRTDRTRSQLLMTASEVLPRL